MKLSDTVATLHAFEGADLAKTLACIEESVRGATAETCATTLSACQAHPEVLAAAGQIKRLAGQINVAIHTLGILRCLPNILQPDEVVEYVSLGAGNAGRAFDLESNQRIAEFKFIRWQGGSEVIQQNALFKDFYLMAEHESYKRKFLYVLGTEYPLKFFNSRRSLSGVLRDAKLQKGFSIRFGGQYRTVRDYYSPRKESVVIADVSHWVPELIGDGVVSEEFVD